VYDKSDMTKSVGWNTDGDPNPTASVSGGAITLDVDMTQGPGVETTQFVGVDSGTIEVWVNHYDEAFTFAQVLDYPATVDVYCYQCLDDSNQDKAGYVKSVTQKASDVLVEGMNWWKVGEFTWPSGSARAKWTTCVTDCYRKAASGDLTSTRALSSSASKPAKEHASTAPLRGMHRQPHKLSIPREFHVLSPRRRSVSARLHSNDPELQFSWRCSTLQGSLEIPCRDKDGSLLLFPNVAKLVLSLADVGNMYPTLDTPYVFTLELSKGSKTPKSFQMPVTLMEQAIPAVSLAAASGRLQPTGSVRINSGDQLVVGGQCTVLDEEHKYNNASNTHMQLKWTFEPEVPAELFETLPGIESELGIDETLVVFPDFGAFVPGSSYVVRLECIDANGLAAHSSLHLSVNAPPRGSPCTACRVSGAVCAVSDPTSGQPIFDIFRFFCPNWADEDAPLQYQFAYFDTSDDESAVILDWSKAASVDVILPPGLISFKAQVRDSLGASTPWMNGVTLAVGQSSGRRMLSAEDRWPDARNLLQESLDLENSAKINQLASALAIEVDDRVAKKADDRETALEKKEHLLGTLNLASKRAIKTEGYMCEALSTAKIISSDSSHISAGSISHIAAFSKDLLASTDSSTLAESCAGSMLTVFGKALGATYENRTCSPEGRGIAQGGHLSQFLTDMDISLKEMLIKSSSQLLTGQQLSTNELKDHSSSSSGFAYSVSKVSTLGGQIENKLDRFSYCLPSEVQLPGNSVKILFGAFERPPNMDGTTPISPAVSLTLASEEGTALDVSNTATPINITIPVSTSELCNGAERTLFTGKVRCLFWDKLKSAYSSDGCITIQDHDSMPTQVTCMCTHLTTFVVEPEIEEINCNPCDAGFFQEQACTSSSHRVCLSCPENTWSDAGSDCKCNAGYTSSDSTTCVACPAGKYKAAGGVNTACDYCPKDTYSDTVGATTLETCEFCSAGKFSAPGSDSIDDCNATCTAGQFGDPGSCTLCPAGSYRTVADAREADSLGIPADGCQHSCPQNSTSVEGSDELTDCECNAGYFGANGNVCSPCPAGTFKIRIGSQNCTGLTSVEIADSSVAPNASNSITVRFKANLNIPAGTIVLLSGLTKTSTPSSELAIRSTKGNTTGSWRYDEGSLRFGLAQPARPGETIAFSFVIRNPSAAQEAPEIRFGLRFSTGHEIELLLPASTAMTVCASGYYGAGCSVKCYGDVVGRACVCPVGRFGTNCRQTGLLLPAVVPTLVQAGVAADLKSPSGVGVSIPAGALTSSETIEVNEVDSATVEMSEQEAKTMLPIGPLAVFTPHGLQFAVPVSLVLKYFPSQMRYGHVPYVYYYNETSASPRWEKMGGTIVGPGLLETNTTHFSTFGVMAVQPEPPPATGSTGSPPASTPSPSQSVLASPSTTPAVVDPNSGISVPLVASLIAAGVIVIFACLVFACLERRRRTHKCEVGFSKTQRSYSQPSVLQPSKDMCIDADIVISAGVSHVGSSTSSTRPEPDDAQLGDEAHGKPTTRLPSMWAPPRASSSRGAVALWMPPSATTAAALSVPARVDGPPQNPKISQPPASSLYSLIADGGPTQPSQDPAQGGFGGGGFGQQAEAVDSLDIRVGMTEWAFQLEYPGLEQSGAPFEDIPGLQDEDRKEFARSSEDETEYLF